jgi:hypothetical protein
MVIQLTNSRQRLSAASVHFVEPRWGPRWLRSRVATTVGCTTEVTIAQGCCLA